MGITFAANLKLYDKDRKQSRRSADNFFPFSAKIAATVDRYGYGSRFMRKIWSPWSGGIPFEIGVSPLSDASGIFAEEFQEPLNWEKIRFPTLLLELWQLPVVEAAMFVRIADGSEPLKKLLSVQGAKEKPGPVSPYLMMNEIVALRARRDVPNRRYYLNKKAHVLRPLD